MLGKIEGRRGGVTEDEMVGRHHSIVMSLGKLRETVKDRDAWCAAVHGVAKRHDCDRTIIVTYGWLFSRGQLFPWHFLQPFILVLWSWSKFSSFDNSCFADFMALGFCGQVRRKEQESYRKGNPFQSSKGDSRLRLRNELSKETHLLTKQETLLGRNAQAEARMVKEPGRTTLPRDSQSRVLCWWNWFPDCLWLIILTQGPSWWCMHCSAKVDVNKKASGTW